jgi:hypothetical protein
MSNKTQQLSLRRERLSAQADAQRAALGRAIEPWRTPLALTDQGLGALQYVRQHPQWLVGGVLLLAVLRPRGLGKWLGRGWVSWQLLNKLRGSQPAFQLPHISSPDRTQVRYRTDR